VPVRLLQVNGVPYEKIPSAEGQRRGHGFSRQVTWMDAMPEDLELREGAWWNPEEPTAVLSISEHAAKNLQAGVGAVLRWSSTGREFEVRVAAVHRLKTVRQGASEDFFFNKAALAGLPAQWYGTLRLPPEKVAVFQRDSYKRFPTVTVINAADVVGIVQEVVDQVALVIRFISAFAILAGAIILASTVAGTRLRRTRESAVLKTIGARRATLVSIFSVEFAILGAVAGLMGGALATVFSRTLMTRFLDAKFNPELLPNLVTIVLTTALAVAAGWLASLRILKMRPLEVLRDE
jgi:putative ABC transport system permease protein